MHHTAGPGCTCRPPPLSQAFYYAAPSGSDDATLRRHIYQELRRARSWQEAQRIYNQYAQQLDPSHVTYLTTSLPDLVARQQQRLSAAEQLQLQQMLQQLAFQMRSQALTGYSPVQVSRVALALSQMGYTDDEILAHLLGQAQRQEALSRRWAAPACALLRPLDAWRCTARWWPRDRRSCC